MAMYNFFRDPTALMTITQDEYNAMQADQQFHFLSIIADSDCDGHWAQPILRSESVGSIVDGLIDSMQRSITMITSYADVYDFAYWLQTMYFSMDTAQKVIAVVALRFNTSFAEHVITGDNGLILRDLVIKYKTLAMVAANYLEVMNHVYD